MDKKEQAYPAEVGNIKFWPTIWNLKRASLPEKMAVILAVKMAVTFL